MALPQLNPHIRHAYNYHRPIISTHSRCYDCRLFFFKESEGRLIANGKEYHFSKGTVIFLPPATEYQFYMTSKKANHLIFNFDLICDFAHLEQSLGTAKAEEFDPERMPDYDLPREFSKPIFQQAPQLFETLEKCTADFLYKPPYYREVCSARLKRCLLELLRSDEAQPESAVIRKITDYVHHRYSDPSLTNEMIAAHFHYHPYYISNLMKQQTGETLHQYLLRYRIRIAKNKLITTDADIGTIAWKCGFNTAAYFIKTFKAHTGMTPKQYRKKHMENF